MDIRNVKIVADSACDLFELADVAFDVAPLKIITAEKEYVDTKETDVTQMVEDLLHYHGRSSTSCPNAGEWLDAFGDAQEVFCVTITGTLSGSYNAARTAKETYEQEYPDRKVFVLDTRSAGPEIALIVEKLRLLVMEGLPFEDICTRIEQYAQKTGLLFMLASMKNLANNGRVSPLVAKMAGLLGIRVLGKASDKGDLEPLQKCRGEEKTLRALVEQLAELGFSNGRINIAHCLNESAALQLKQMIYKAFGKVDVKLYRCGALCSFYAEKGGMLVGFEKQ